MSLIDPTAEIHPSAVVYEGATIGPGCTIGPFSVIGAHAVLGKGTRVGPHVVIEGHTTLGENNVVYQFASIGAPPQDIKFKGEPSVLEIGSGNTIREYVTLQPGTAHGQMRTAIGNNNLFMACCHVAHDVVVGSSNWMANSAALGGHVQVGDGVVIGGLCGVHQFVRVGSMSMLGAGAMVAKDVPPFCMAHGDRARLVGINAIGMKRNGLNEDDVVLMRRVFRTFFFKGGTLDQRLARAKEESGENEAARRFLDFLALESKRGITFPRRGEEPNEA